LGPAVGRTGRDLPEDIGPHTTCYNRFVRARLVNAEGFMQRPDIPRLLEEAQQWGCEVRLEDVTYYIGHESILHRQDGVALPRWHEALFAAMRNASHMTDYFRLPTEQVVEIGRQISV
jgi:KUP system potassium uptake protein